MDTLNTFFDIAGLYFTTAVRWVFLFLTIFILARQIRSLLRAKNPSEIWAYLGCPDGSSVPLTHWENLIGRGRGCDIILNLNSVSRSHATLIRDSAGVWKYNDLDSKNGSAINGIPVEEPTVLKAGDVLTIGGADFTLYPVSLHERIKNIENRKHKTTPVSPWPTLVALTIFQLLTVIQFRVSLEDEFPAQLPVSFACLCALMWGYVIVLRLFRRVGFEMEMIAFFLSTLSLAVTTSAYPDTVFKQMICVCLGVAVFFGLCWYLRDLNRAKRIVYILMGISVILLLINLAIGTVSHGAQNWIYIGGFSLQPSELVKIVFIFVGAATLDELQKRKNLLIFMGFSVFCLGCLALMGDFGTAMIFFVTFLIISFLRSGDFSKIILIVGAAGLMGMMVLRFKPYIAGRFDTWGHVWDDPTGGGFQQVQTMTSTASGGLLGLGAGEGNLSDIFAASTDLVFGVMAEEWGLIIAILAVLCIITLGVFAVRSIIAGRSTYYSIAACAATSLFIFQTILNVFGSVDLLPLTGVTFPFVSSGGTSMITAWGLLAFLKAADTRQNASIAIRLDKKGEFDNEMEMENFDDPDEIFRIAGKNDVQDRRKKQKQQKFDQMDYTYHSNKETLVKPGASQNKRQIKYKEISDDDFFNKLDHARSVNSSKHDDILETLRNGPTDEPRKVSKRSGSSAGGSRTSRSNRTGNSANSGASGGSVKSRNNQSKNVGQARGSQAGNSKSHNGQARSNGQVRNSQKRNDQGRSGRTVNNQVRGTQTGNRQAQGSRTRNRQPNEDNYQPLTLEDIFGGDKK